MKTSHVTNEYSQSRRLYSPIILEARENLIAQKRFITFERYNPWSKTFRQETTLDFKSLDNLISNKYEQLRGLYDVPIHYDEFRFFIYSHDDLRRYRYSDNVVWPKSTYYPWRWKTHGPYRQGTKFVQHGIEKKAEPVSDQYQINPKAARQDWRKSKGFQRDKSKGTHFCNCRLTDGRYRRRAEKAMIAKGKAEEIYFNKNQYTDGWMCC